MQRGNYEVIVDRREAIFRADRHGAGRATSSSSPARATRPTRNSPTTPSRSTTSRSRAKRSKASASSCNSDHGPHPSRNHRPHGPAARCAPAMPQRARSRVCTDSRALKAGRSLRRLARRKIRRPRLRRRGGAARRRRRDRRRKLPAELAGRTSPSSRCADTLRALQRLAAELPPQSCRCRSSAITGSNGKTSTKDLTAAVLGERFQVTKTEGNFNNHIGLPLTMLRARGSDQVGVFEMGMNHPGRDRAARGDRRAGCGDHHQHRHGAHRVHGHRARRSRRKKGCSPKRCQPSGT